jgi:hypothetical protein
LSGTVYQAEHFNASSLLPNALHAGSNAKEMRTIYIIGIDNDPDGCYITDALEKPEHTIAGPFHSQQSAVTHAVDAELRVHSRWNEILPEPDSNRLMHER